MSIQTSVLSTLSTRIYLVFILFLGVISLPLAYGAVSFATDIKTDIKTDTKQRMIELVKQPVDLGDGPVMKEIFNGYFHPRFLRLGK